MSDTSVVLKRQIGAARDLRSVVRAMKAIASSNINRCERSVRASTDYVRAVELALGLCLRENGGMPWADEKKGRMVGAVVFGTDQGLVGQFNEVVVEEARKTLAALSSESYVWAVGERVYARLADSGLSPKGLFNVPNTVQAILPLVGRILVETESLRGRDENYEFHLFYNRSAQGLGVTPVHQRLLPLDEAWSKRLIGLDWPSGSLPEILGGSGSLKSLVGEYLFVTIFRACSESLASENESRLAAMDRADDNIGELLEALTGESHRQRQGGIDEELFDVISGFEALNVKRDRKGVVLKR
jgi:F-type H+-transporting ATPase subunit gamma